MPRVTYDGPHDAVDLVGVGAVKRGQSITVSADLAEELTSRPDWSPARTNKTKEA